MWRLVDDELNSSSYVRMPGEDDPPAIVNLSVWTGLESLTHFMYRSGHAIYLRAHGPTAIGWPVHHPVTSCVTSGVKPQM